MPDCFISYASQDLEIASFIESELKRHKLEVFMASASLEPGEQWTEKIWISLRSCPWILLLATQESCRSPYVQQEVGMALAHNKRLVPILWNIKPPDLPGWVSRAHAIDLQGGSVDTMRQKMLRLAKTIHADKRKAMLILGGLITAAVIFSKEDK